MRVASPRTPKSQPHMSGKALLVVQLILILALLRSPSVSGSPVCTEASNLTKPPRFPARGRWPTEILLLRLTATLPLLILYIISRLRFPIAGGSRCLPSGVAYPPQHQLPCMCVCMWGPRTEAMQNTVTAKSTDESTMASEFAIQRNPVPRNKKTKQTNL